VNRRHLDSAFPLETRTSLMPPPRSMSTGPARRREGTQQGRDQWSRRFQVGSRRASQSELTQGRPEARERSRDIPAPLRVRRWGGGQFCNSLDAIERRTPRRQDGSLGWCCRMHHAPSTPTGVSSSATSTPKSTPIEEPEPWRVAPPGLIFHFGRFIILSGQVNDSAIAPCGYGLRR
jgi:hypothetical protein